MSAKSLVLSLAVLVGLTSSVSAQDTFTWTGVYVGVQAGYGWGDADLKNYVPGLAGQSTPDPDGFLGGVYVGYSHHFQNNLVAGLEADIVLSGADSGFETVLDRRGNPFPPNQDATEVDYSAGLRVRVGYAIDRFLPYVSGGLAVAHADFTYDTAGDNAFIPDTLIGWTIGGGIEYAATDDLVLRAEYRFSDFGDGSANAFPLFPVEEQRYELKSHDVRFGVSYKF